MSAAFPGACGVVKALMQSLWTPRIPRTSLLGECCISRRVWCGQGPDAESVDPSDPEDEPAGCVMAGLRGAAVYPPGVCGVAKALSLQTPHILRTGLLVA